MIKLIKRSLLWVFKWRSLRLTKNYMESNMSFQNLIWLLFQDSFSLNILDSMPSQRAPVGVVVKVDSYIKIRRFNCIFQMINCKRDFVTGAMEQWGLITYRETSLLFDSVNGATSSKQSKTSTISHEYVHQWFGNLMTCNWWDNIWIQEGPATYYKVI